MSLEIINIIPTAILVLAEGKTDAEVNNRRGHLFEQFMAKVLEQYGYETPKRTNLNVTQAGIELDIETRHRLNHGIVIAECKAYSTPLPAKALTNFYGKLNTYRFDEADTIGFFIAIPGLVPDGYEKAKKIKQHDKRFDVLDADGVELCIKDLKLISEMPSAPILTSDKAIIITEHGIFSAVKELDIGWWPLLRRCGMLSTWSR